LAKLADAEGDPLASMVRDISQDQMVSKDSVTKPTYSITDTLQAGLTNNNLS
jgi:hypothetical protein